MFSYCFGAVATSKIHFMKVMDLDSFIEPIVSGGYACKGLLFDRYHQGSIHLEPYWSPLNGF